MIYTSGSTGEPKGAVLTHGNLVASTSAMLRCWQWTDADRLVFALPLSHLHGLGVGLHGWLASGCHATLFDRFDAERVLVAMARGHATLFLGVPTMYEKLLEAVRGGAPMPASMRIYTCGSAPLATETFERFERVFGHRILVRYGLSETAMVTSSSSAEPSARKPGSIGRPVPGVALRIAGQEHGDGDAGPQSASECGELQVRGANVTPGYWRAPEATRAAFSSDGWFRTGDLGRRDAAGNYFLIGRTTDVILTGGFNVHPREVMERLLEHTGVLDAAVVGVPDPLRGELVKAIVVPRDPALTEGELKEFCARGLAGYKVPRVVEYRDELPRTETGKLDRARLQGDDPGETPAPEGEPRVW